MRLWMRQEADPDERRAPIVPTDAGRLVAAGASVTVERSAHRVFPAEEYAAAGCALAAAGRLGVRAARTRPSSASRSRGRTRGRCATGTSSSGTRTRGSGSRAG